MSETRVMTARPGWPPGGTSRNGTRTTTVQTEIGRWRLTCLATAMGRLTRRWCASGSFGAHGQFSDNEFVSLAHAALVP